MIVLPSGFRIEIIGTNRKTLLLELWKKVQDITESNDSYEPNLILYIGGCKLPELNPSIPIVLGIMSKEEIKTASKLLNPTYIPSIRNFYQQHKQKQLTVLEYIYFTILFTCIYISENTVSSGILTIPDEWYQRFSFISSLTYVRKNIEFIYESGEDKTENQIRMHWLKSKVKKPIYILFNKKFSNESIKEYLVPFTILGVYQNGFLISDDGLENSEKMYTTLMELWNTTHYIPKRKQYLLPVSCYKDLYEEKEFDPEFEIAIKRPPIFIIDSIEYIVKYLTLREEDCIVFYVGNFEKFQKIINEIEK